jgi:hypothetical protein
MEGELECKNILCPVHSLISTLLITKSIQGYDLPGSHDNGSFHWTPLTKLDKTEKYWIGVYTWFFLESNTGFEVA